MHVQYALSDHQIPVILNIIEVKQLIIEKMKRNNILWIMLLMALLFGMGRKDASAQNYQIGDVYTFPDGSKGVVCWVNPKDAKRGWVVDLNDLPGNYVMWTGNCPAGTGSTYGLHVPPLTSWGFNGKQNTEVLLNSGQSPAAEAVDFYSGWYTGCNAVL